MIELNEDQISDALFKVKNELFVAVKNNDNYYAIYAKSSFEAMSSNSHYTFDSIKSLCIVEKSFGNNSYVKLYTEPRKEVYIFIAIAILIFILTSQDDGLKLWHRILFSILPFWFIFIYKLQEIGLQENIEAHLNKYRILNGSS